MFEPRLFAALAAGSTVVTPNNRMARALVAAYDRVQQSRGRKAWAAPRALPWGAWLDQLWSDAIAHDALPSIDRVLRAPQARRRWKHIVDADDATIANPLGAADLAAQAWTLARTWGSGGESWRAWRSDALADDSATFGGWAERFHATLRDLRAVDEASLADALAGAARAVPAWRNLDVVLAGFLEATPQQQRLIAGLTAIGSKIARLDTIAGKTAPLAMLSAASPRDEMLAALTWARDEALANSGATIGIAVEDLAARRAEVIALAEDVLCPALELPGHERDTRPYNVSLGTSLANAPLVAAALGWIELAVRPSKIGQAAALMRSPYLPNAQTNWPRRAAIERDWLNDGRRDVALGDAIAALERADNAYAGRLKRAAAANRFPRDAAPKAWVDAWRAWLAAVGWPDDRTLDSAEQQTRDAFDQLLAEFAAIALVDARMRASDAANALRDLAAATLFQPETPPVPIQIVGLLEATGLPFDRLWIAGMVAHRWPQPPQPHPLLPLAWQRDRDVPRSSAARELRFARAATAMLLRGAPQVVVSYAQSADDDEPPRPSELVALCRPTPFKARSANVRGAAYARRIHAARPQLEMIADLRAPAIAEGTRIKGGAHAIEAQADCPFRATALHRLRVDPWPQPIMGLTAIERGTLVHAAMANLWNDVRDSATLASLSAVELDERIVRASATAMESIKAPRWQWVPAIIASGEATRLRALLREWIDRYERPRPPFVVDANEIGMELALGGIALRFRIDRIDRMPNGSAIIDYKTGVTVSPRNWFDPRPRAPQIGLYALARRQSAPDSPTRAVAYAQLRAGELKVNGVAANVALWPQLAPIETTAVGSWAACEAWWDERLRAMADELRNGVATVTPRDGPKTCRTCGLWALCRIRSAAVGGAESDDD